MINRFFRHVRSALKKKPSPSGKVSALDVSGPGEGKSGRETNAGPAVKKNLSKKGKAKAKQDGTSTRQSGGMPTSEPWESKDFKVSPAAGKTRFHDLPLPPEIMHAIAELNFEYCSPVQAETFPKSLAGTDVIGQAQTGTGKTAAFLITIMARFLADPVAKKRATGAPRALILAPTRELVMQISKEAQELARYCPLRVVSVFGGIDYRKQQSIISSGPVDIMVATPGRLLDFQRQRKIDLKKVEILVIDEADHMLDMGFIPDVRSIVFSTPPKEKRQTLFFSATMTPEVRNLSSRWTKNALIVEIEPEQVEVDSVEQIVYLTTADEKYNLLYNLIIGKDLTRVMIFANRRDETRRLTDRLKRNGISCAMLSGEVPQNKRIKTLDDFRNGRIRVLVATDVAGRGIHIDDVSHVINYTLPYDPEDYVHRIGRTGRAGATGTSISFACEEGSFYIPDIEQFLGHKLQCVYPDEHLLAPAPRGTIKIDTPKKYIKAKSRSGSRRKRYTSR